MDQIDEKLDRLANVIQTLTLEVGRRQPIRRSYWPQAFFASTVLLIATFVYFYNKIEVRRQADIAIIGAVQESTENYRKLDKKIDAYLGVHVEQMGPNHRQRYWEALKPYFQGENK